MSIRTGTPVTYISIDGYAYRAFTTSVVSPDGTVALSIDSEHSAYSLPDGVDLSAVPYSNKRIGHSYHRTGVVVDA